MIESWQDVGKRYSLIKSSCVYVVHKHKHAYMPGRGDICVCLHVILPKIIGVNFKSLFSDKLQLFHLTIIM